MIDPGALQNPQAQRSCLANTLTSAEAATGAASDCERISAAATVNAEYQ
jgi:hypothetical protein